MGWLTRLSGGWDLLKHAATVTAFATLGFSLDDAGIDLELTKAYRGTVALPIKPGKHSRVAVKIVDDKGMKASRWWR